MTLTGPGGVGKTRVALQVAAEVLDRFEHGVCFVERARTVQADFRVTDDNAAILAEICRRVDGLPLAIELAAARTRLLPPRAMLARLDRRLPLLTGGPRDLPARQQTLRDTIAWSYDLLSELERRLFERLGVFVGGCTIASAEAVGGPDGALDLDVLEGLAALVSRSLLRRQEQADGEPRFSMLETIREYALERLEASGEAAEVRRRHAEHFMALAEEARPGVISSQGGVWMDRLEVEHDNLRAAMAWSDAASEPNVLARIAGSLWRFWWMRCYFSDGVRWLSRALECVTEPARRIDVLYGAATLMLYQDDAARSLDLWTEMIELARTHGDRRSHAIALSRRGFMHRNIGQMERAVADATEALTIARELGDSRVLGHALNGFAQAARGEVNLDVAEAAWTEALARCREIDEDFMVAHMLHNLGSIALQRGELDKAMRLCTEGLASMRRRHDRFALRPALVTLMRLSHLRGDEDQALALAREVVTFSANQGSPVTAAHALDGVAWVAIRRGDAVRAARLLGAADGLRRATGFAFRAEQRPLQQDAETLTRAALGEEDLASAWAEGEAMTLEQAAAYALSASRPT